MKLQKLLLCVVLVISLLVPVLQVGASQATRERLRELQNQAGEATERVTDARNLLEGTQSEMNEILARMQVFDDAHGLAVEALHNIELSILETQMRIYYAEQDLAEAITEREIQYEVFRTRLRVMHEHGSISMFEVLFQSENISDFFMRMEYVRAFAQFDRDMLARFEQAESEVSSQFDTLTRNMNLLIALEADLQASADEIQREVDAHVEWLQTLQHDAEAFQLVLDLFEEEQRVLQEDVAATQARLNREVAEQERIRREEEARRQAELQRERLARLDNPSNAFGWPVPARTHISSYFGDRPNPFNASRTEFHTGIDIPAPPGTMIVAAADGYVRFVGWSGGYGNTVIIDHANGYSTLYAHNSVNRVREGQFVTRGQHIADVGSTGMSTGPHLHFEIRVNNQARNPMNYFPGR